MTEGWHRGARSPLFKNVPDQASVYFVHSYYCDLTDQNNVSAITQYGLEYASALQKENIYGVQFHPEKSSKVGLLMLSNFVDIVSRGDF